MSNNPKAVRNNRKVKRTSFKRITQPNRRIKSKTGKSVSSTKIGKGSVFSKLMVKIKRVMNRRGA